MTWPSCCAARRAVFRSGFAPRWTLSPPSPPRWLATGGVAFYGDERQEIGPQELFEESDAVRAIQNVEFVAKLCGRLLAQSGSS
jgi:hypothetical protein